MYYRHYRLFRLTKSKHFFKSKITKNVNIPAGNAARLNEQIIFNVPILYHLYQFLVGLIKFDHLDK